MATMLGMIATDARIAPDLLQTWVRRVAGYMLKELGLRNVVTSAEEWPTVGWETIAKANPTILVIARMDRRRFPADDYEKKLEFLKSDPSSIIYTRNS